MRNILILLWFELRWLGRERLRMMMATTLFLGVSSVALEAGKSFFFKSLGSPDPKAALVNFTGSLTLVSVVICLSSTMNKSDIRAFSLLREHTTSWVLGRWLALSIQLALALSIGMIAFFTAYSKCWINRITWTAVVSAFFVYVIFGMILASVSQAASAAARTALMGVVISLSILLISGWSIVTPTGSTASPHLFLYAGHAFLLSGNANLGTWAWITALGLCGVGVWITQISIKKELLS